MKNRVLVGVGVLVAVVLLIGGGLATAGTGYFSLEATPSVSSSAEPTEEAATDPTPEPTPSPSISATPTAEPTCSSEDRVSAILAGMGLDRSDVRIDDEIDWTEVPSGRVSTDFNFGGAMSYWADIKDRLTTVGDVSAAYSDAFDGVLLASDIQGADVVGIQVINPTELAENYQRVGNSAKVFPTTSEAGEVIWVLLPEDCSEQSQIVGIRRVCGNPVIWRKEG